MCVWDEKKSGRCLLVRDIHKALCDEFEGALQGNKTKVHESTTGVCCWNVRAACPPDDMEDMQHCKKEMFVDIILWSDKEKRLNLSFIILLCMILHWSK